MGSLPGPGAMASEAGTAVTQCSGRRAACEEGKHLTGGSGQVRQAVGGRHLRGEMG